MIDPSEGKEIKKDYLDILNALLEKIYQKTEEKGYQPDKQLSVRIGNESVYKSNDEGRFQGINPFVSKELVEKLEKAINDPANLKNVVSIKIGKEELFRVQGGEVKTDKIGLANSLDIQRSPTVEVKETPEAIIDKQVESINENLNEQTQIVEKLSTESLSPDTVNQLMQRLEGLSEKITEQQKTIIENQQKIEKLSKMVLPPIQNTKLQNWVGKIESKVKQSSRNIFDRVKDAIMPTVDKRINEVKTKIDSLKSDVTQRVEVLKSNVSDRIDNAKQKAIEQSVKALLKTFGTTEKDGSLSFKTKSFDFEQKGDKVSVKTKTGDDVIVDGTIVAPEQLDKLEQIQPGLDAYQAAYANMEQPTEQETQSQGGMKR